MNREQLISRLAQRHRLLVSAGPWRSWQVRSASWRAAGLAGRVADCGPARCEYPPRWLIDPGRWPALSQTTARIGGRRYQRILGTGDHKLFGLIFHPVHWPYLRGARPRHVHYHVYDHFRKTPGWNPRLEALDRELLARADVVTAVSRLLAETLEKLVHRKVHWLPNGVDFQLFNETAEAEPSDLASIPGPRVGYIGRLNRKVDFDLIVRLAAARPQWQFVLVGPVANLDARSEPGYWHCLTAANIRFLGEKRPDELPAYVAGMDVNLMCYTHRDDLWVQWGYPLKLHEYLATGRPVVSTDLDSVREFAAVVDIAHTDAEWLAAIEAGIGDGDAARAARRRDVARANSWDERVRVIESLMPD
ncbi:glycosyltransferase [Arhodomonas sp. SL1]|uniref:glycosyltransferase n=1 Tax=Arhodomonas sp. SL1 TaxID=3425691 RepID=UPI003F880CD4